MEFKEMLEMAGMRVQQGMAELPPAGALKALALPGIAAAIHPLAGVVGYLITVSILVFLSRKSVKEQHHV